MATVNQYRETLPEEYFTMRMRSRNCYLTKINDEVAFAILPNSNTQIGLVVVWGLHYVQNELKYRLTATIVIAHAQW